MSYKVLLFADSMTYGGAQKAMVQLMQGLDRDKWQPLLVHHASDELTPLQDEATKASVQCIQVPEMPLGMQGLSKLPAFVKMLRREAPDVFHAHLSWPLACKWALAGAIWAGVPGVVLTEHLFLEIRYSKSALLQQRLMARRVAKYIAVSESIAGNLIHLVGIPERKIRVIPNGADAAADDKQPCPQELTELTGRFGKPVILTIARLVPQKGHRYLVEAAAQLPEVIFAIIGDGPERRSLEEQVRLLGLQERVFFYGFRSDIPNWLGSCAAFVLPSLFEGMPIVLLEAMAAGKPVVATAIPGNNEVVIQGVTGLLVPPGDPGALVTAIRTILADSASAGLMGRAGRKVVLERFSVRKVVQSVEQVYAESLESKYRSYG